VPPLVIVFVTVFIDLLGFGIIIPLLPFYAETFGASAFTIGLLSASFSLMQFLFAPVWGRLSDRIGRRPVLLMGLLGSFIAYLCFAFAGSLRLLFAARIAAGIAGANIPTAQAYIADTTTPENRARGMGLVGAAFGLGFVFGPAVGGFLSQWGYAAAALFAAALSLCNFVAAWFLLPESRPAISVSRPRRSRVETFRRALDRPFLPVLLMVYFVVIAAFSSFEATFALFSERRFGFGVSSIGYLFAFVGVVLVLVQGVLVGPVALLIGERRLVPLAILTIAIGLVSVPLAPSPVALAAALGVMAVGMGLNSPSLISLISRLAGPDEQGAVLGVSQSLASLARVVGPAWGGLLFDRAGITAPFISAAIVMLLAFMMSVAGLRRLRVVPCLATASEVR
jgi:multidrug resistance protein